MSKEIFILTHEHITLLQHSIIRWNSRNCGALCVDTKRPYGTGFISADMVEILGEDPSDGYPISTLHRETEMALRVILSAKSFVPGRYVNRQGRGWKLEFE